MATVKFDEGTKFETKLDLQDDEFIVFVKPPKNRISRVIEPGFAGKILGLLTLGIATAAMRKAWLIQFVITNKRVIAIPMPPNKKNYTVESFYFKDISGAKATKQDEAAARFILTSAGKQAEFILTMEMTAKNLVGAFVKNAQKVSAEASSWSGHGYDDWNKSFNSSSNKSFIQSQYNYHYKKMEEIRNMDFSNEKHSKLRDFIVDLIKSSAAEAN